MNVSSVRIISMGAVALAGIAVAGASPSAGAAATRIITVPCSSSTLSSAIVTANGLGTATLRLAPNCVYAITTPAVAITAFPAITGNVTILGGPNTAIRRASTAPTTFRLFDVSVGGTLRLRGLSLQNGSATGDGGGIVNTGTLELDRVTLSGNAATGLGGAIRNGPGAFATVTRTVIKANSAGLAGAGIDNSGVVIVTDSRLTANNGANGGGTTTEGAGTTRFVRSTIDHNFGAGAGGGIQNAGTTSIDRTLVERNRAGNGGGILVGGGTVTATRSVVRLDTPNNCFPANSVAGCVG